MGEAYPKSKKKGGSPFMDGPKVLNVLAERYTHWNDSIKQNLLAMKHQRESKNYNLKSKL